MQLGIGSYTFPWSLGVEGYLMPSQPMTIADLIRLAEEHHLPLIQIADNVPLHKYTESELEAVRDLAHEKGVKLEIGTRGTDPDLLRRYISIGQYLDAKLLRTIITELDFTAAEEQIKAVLLDLEHADITLAIENHGLQSTRTLAGMFDRLNHSLVGCCIDTVNSFSALDMPDRVIEDLTPYVVNLHIKDFEIQRIDHMMGFQITGTAAGSGRLNIPNVLEKIRSIGRSPTCILELWTPYTNSVDETTIKEREWFMQSIAYLNSIDFSG